MPCVPGLPFFMTAAEQNRLPADPPGLRLGGRIWQTIDSEPVCRKAQAWIGPQLAAHGIRMQPRPVVFPLLGSLLLPAELPDTAWTPGVAVRTGKFLGQVCDESEKELLLLALTSWSLGQAGIDLRDFMGLSAVATRWKM